MALTKRREKGIIMTTKTATKAAKTTARKTATTKYLPDTNARVRKAASKATSARPAAKKTAMNKDPMDRDFTYLQDKDPSDLHVTLAKLIEQRADIEITPKQVQAVLSMHPHFQRSKLNKARPGYVGLDEEIVTQRSVHMVQAHKDAAANIAARAAQKPARKAAAKKTTAKASR
jgi:hypothetical protein